MYIGEMTLLVVAVLVMTGLARGITARLFMNDFAATFMIFLIVLLNVRGGITLTKSFTLSVGGALSVVVCTYAMIRRSEKGSDLLSAILAMAVDAGIVFIYSAHFLPMSAIDPRVLATLLSLIVGLWSAVAARRTFASCLFSSVTGSFLGATLYLLFLRKSGNIGGNYTFTVMWLGAIFGLLLQYLLSLVTRGTRSPRANTSFEAGEMAEEEDEEERPK